MTLPAKSSQSSIKSYFVEQWANRWGGREQRECGEYHDYPAEHNDLWKAFQAKDWATCEALSVSQLSANCYKYNEANYLNGVRFVISARSGLGLAVDGPVLGALKAALEVLQWPKGRAAEITQHWIDHTLAANLLTML